MRAVQQVGRIARAVIQVIRLAVNVPKRTDVQAVMPSVRPTAVQAALPVGL